MLRQSVRLAMFLRSFAIQGSWNYRTLIGTGFGFALLPALRSIHGRRGPEVDAAVARHTQLFNSHPYLAGVALAAVSQLEADRADPHVVERFKGAVRSSLGSLGDGLVWAGWRPACALLGLSIVFAGAPWWVGPAVFLVTYNAGHLALRVWGFRIGFVHGRNVGEVLKRAHLASVQQIVTRAGAFLLGMALPLILVRGAGHDMGRPWIAVGIAAAILGLRFGNVVRTPIVAGMVVVLIAGLLLGTVL